MTDEKVEQEAPVQEEQEQSQVDNQETSEEVSKPANDQQINWEKANQALRYQQQRIAELEERLAQSEKVQVKEEPDEFAGLDPEDYLPVGKAKQMAANVAKKEAAEAAKQAVEEYSKQQNLVHDEQRMRSKYEDYDYMIENFAIPQIKNDPALAYKIQNSKNPAETAYKLAKLSEQYEDSKMKQQTSSKAEKIIKNSSRPLSGSAAPSPLKSQADQFSNMSQQQIWELSQKYARGA